MRSFWLCTVVIASAALAENADTSDVEALLDEPIVSGVSRVNERADDAPATVITVTQEQFKQFGLRTVADAINFMSLGLLSLDPLHSVETGSRGVLLHGDYGNHLVLVVDGHLLNEPWDGTAYVEQGLGIPLELIDHVELIPGPGSVNYGSYAMLGVVNIVTRRAKNLPPQVHVDGWLSPGQDVNATPVLAGFGGGGRIAALWGLEQTLLGSPLEAVIALEYQATQGQRLAFAMQSGLTDTDGTRTWPMNWGSHSPRGSWGGTTANWGWQAPSALLKVRWGEFEVWAKGSLYQRGSPAMGTASVVQGNFGADNWERDRFVNLEIKWSHTLNARVHLWVRAYFDLYDYFENQVLSSWPSFGSGIALPNDLENFTFVSQLLGASQWGGVEAIAAVDWLGDGRYPLLAGVDLRGRAYQSSEPFRGEDGTLLDRLAAYSLKEWAVAPWLQQRARFLSSLEANVGVRLDAQTAFGPRFSPRAAVVWVTPWQGHVKGIFSTAFRSPVGYERFQEVPGYQVKNPGVRPETVLTGELSYEQRLGRHRALLTGFVSRYIGLIRLGAAPADVGPPGTYWYTNEGTLLNLGASALAEGIIGPLTYGVNLTVATNQSDTSLVASPTWFGNARLGWSWGDGLPRLAIAASFTGLSLVDTALNTTGALEYSGPQQLAAPQVNLRATVEVPTLPIKGLSVRFVVGSSLSAFSPFAAGPKQSPDPSSPAEGPFLLPNSRLFVMASLSWTPAHADQPGQ